MSNRDLPALCQRENGTVTPVLVEKTEDWPDWRLPQGPPYWAVFGPLTEAEVSDWKRGVASERIRDYFDEYYREYE